MADSQDTTKLTAGSNQADNWIVVAWEYQDQQFSRTHKNAIALYNPGTGMMRRWNGKLGKYEDTVTGLASNDPEATPDVSNPPGTNPINTEVSDGNSNN